ncbi:oligomeric Golgi complex subunit 6-like protein [Phycomyces nitens]|nr:oligomeric Golgi complex subunit 6-like protein [Phycomyces nitens]
MDTKSPPFPTLSFANKPNKPLASKLTKVLNGSVADDARIKTALTALSDIPNVDQADLRSNLRGTIEKKEIEINRQFLDAFSSVVMQLERLEIEAQAMTSVCKDMQLKLNSTQKKTMLMMEQASSLDEQRSACATRLLIVDGFLEKFMLNEEEIKILTSSLPVGNAFFEALAHLQQIYSDCKLLLTTKHQQAGQHIMETMAMYQETAYAKLYRWTQYESRSSFGNDSIDVSSLMVKALSALQHRPVLLQTILDELAGARREAVARAFINALTRGGPGGTPRPIELQAHDSQRYIGDMLAWVHQACASEREMLESLFQPVTSSHKSDSPSLILSSKEVVEDLLDCAMEGTCRPLKSRMEQVLMVQQNALISYRVANLIQFYAVTMSKLVQPEAALAKTLYEITGMAYAHFFKTIQAQADRLLQSPEIPSRDLSVSPLVRDMSTQLRDILASYDSSLIVATNNTGGFPEFDFGETLDALVDPLLRMCEMAVENLDSVDRAIYMVNCMYHLNSVMAPYSFTENKRKLLDIKINELLENLAQEQYKELLQQSGLARINDALLRKEKDVPLSSMPLMDSISFQGAISRLDSFLVRISSEVSPPLRRLSTLQHTRQVQESAIRLLLETYSRISAAINDPANGYSDPESILPRTVDEMEAIFSFAL